MKRSLVLAIALAPLLSACYIAAAGAAGYVVHQYVERDQVQVAQVASDVDWVWPRVKETLGYYQEPGSVPVIQDFPRTINARVDGAKVTVEVEALDLDLTTIRVSAEKFLSKDGATALEVLNGILKALQKG